MVPAGGAFGAGGVVDADGSVAAHVTIEPESSTVLWGEAITSGGETTGGWTNPAPEPEPGEGPVVKPAVVKTKKACAGAAPPNLHMTADTHCIAMSLALFVLGTAVLPTAHCC